MTFTKKPHKLTFKTKVKSIKGREIHPNITLIAARLGKSASIGVPVIDDILIIVLGKLIRTESPLVNSSTRNSPSMQLPRCAANACFAYAFISCLDLILFVLSAAAPAQN